MGEIILTFLFTTSKLRKFYQKIWDCLKVKVNPLQLYIWLTLQQNFKVSSDWSKDIQTKTNIAYAFLVSLENLSFIHL